MDVKFSVLYNDGKFTVTYEPSLTIITTEDELQLLEMFSAFIDSHEIQKEIDNVL